MGRLLANIIISVFLDFSDFVPFKMHGYTPKFYPGKVNDIEVY
jgi:hypothetical protein